MEVWLFIFGHLIHFIGSCILLAKIHSTRSVYGLSVDTQICVCVATLSRCIWSLETRLVETYVAYLELGLSTAVSLFLCYQMFSLRHTSIEQARWQFRFFVTLPLSFIIAVIYHPGTGWLTMQTLVSFTIYTEAIALLPQLDLMRRKVIAVEPVTRRYVFSLIVAHVVRLFFWLSLFYQGEKFFGLFLADLIHTALAGDYIYMWMSKMRKYTLPMSDRPSPRSPEFAQYTQHSHYH
eukprot:GHVN01044905.1.p1 GENE.GHVN01044905.1~~GHVN01044905.1.p1  ORF type:complete len:236 (-),score=25.67 GHVN01044905.1:483-1190(-)